MLATPGTCVAMEASVAGLPADSLKSIPDVGAIDRIDATQLSVTFFPSFLAPEQDCLLPIRRRQAMLYL